MSFVLRKWGSEEGGIWLAWWSYESEEVFRLPSAFTGSGEDGDGDYPGDDYAEALDAVDTVLDALVVLLKHTHGGSGPRRLLCFAIVRLTDRRKMALAMDEKGLGQSSRMEAICTMVGS